MGQGTLRWTLIHPNNALQYLAHEPFNCIMWSFGLFEILGILNFLSIEWHIIAYLKGDIPPSGLSTLSRTHKVSSLRTTSYIEIDHVELTLSTYVCKEVLQTLFPRKQQCVHDVDVQAKVFSNTLYLLLFVTIVFVIAVIIRECGRCGSWGKRVLADTFWLSPATLYSIQHCSASPIVDNWWSSWSSLLPVIIISINLNHCYQ